MDGIARSFALHRVTTTGAHRTIADGVAVSGPSQRTFELIERHVDEMVSVGDESIAQAIVTLIERAKFVVEGAGALGVAAIMSGRYRPRGKTLVVISGGNIDINLLGSIVRRGLVEAGRYQHLAVEVSDTPGELALVSTIIGKVGGNILEVDHNRESPGMPVGVAVLELVLEVNGPAQFNEIVEALRAAGYETNLETSGAYPLSGHWDWICLSPKKFKAPLPELVNYANELKVVIYHPSDFEWAEKYAAQLPAGARRYLQPEWDKRAIVLPLIIEYIKQHPEWELSAQLHKYIDVP